MPAVTLDTAESDLNSSTSSSDALLQLNGAPHSLKELQSFRSERSTTGITFASQAQLPRLPIPDLEDTLYKFPSFLEALQTSKQQEETKRVVEEFLAGDGPILQEALLEYERAGVEDGAIGSYVEEFWNESYLSPDASVVLNLNPFFVLEDAPDPKVSKDQLRRAAELCFASIKLASALRNEALPPDVFRGNALCMDQFKALFASSRQPNVHDSDCSCDEVHVYSDSTHVVVLCKNQFYYFPALWPKSFDVAVDEADILDILRAIQTHAIQTPDEESSRDAIGVFSSLPRSEWALAREELCQSEKNAAALHIIDSALFVLVLDDYTPSSIHAAAANMLHGTNRLAEDDTYQVGSCLNRWYDKLQLIVCKDGTAGCNFEHSAIDGHTALRFVSDVFAETVISFAESIVDLIHGRGRIQHVVEATIRRAASVTHDEKSPTLDVFPKRIVFDLPTHVMERIYYAETALCDNVVASDTFVLEFKEYGKLLIVGNKMSPDSFVQMAIMLAYYMLYGKVVSTYEPVMTKTFYHGRTEAMRSATVQAKELCETWCDKSKTREQKLHALRVATIEHSRLVKECSVGMGVDRHLFSLKCIAERQGMPLPAFFESEAWKMLNHTILSTSNCGNPALRLFGFGPVVQDGFGVGYIIKDSGISFSVSSKHRQTQRFVRSLNNTLRDMEQLLQPTTKVEVGTRLPLSSVKHVDHCPTTYDDIFGESSYVPRKEPLPVVEETVVHEHRRRSTRRASKFFMQVKERSLSYELLRDPDVHINLDLQGEEK